MFRWFYKKKIEDDDFVVLDIHDTDVSITNESSDVTPDILSDVTSVPADEYTCMYYEKEEEYDTTHIDVISDSDSDATDAVVNTVVTVAVNTVVDAADLSDDSSDLSDGSNASEENSADTFYNHVEWTACVEPKTDLLQTPTDDTTEIALRNILDFFIRVDSMVDEIISNRYTYVL
jgi:hypothetical protein